MKKRLIAVALTVIMLCCSLPLYASAVVTPTLSLYDFIVYSINYHQYTYYITSDMTVSSDTVVPEGFTLYLMNGVKLTLNAKLTVRGALYNNGGTIVNASNIYTDGGIVYDLGAVQTYDPYYYYYYYNFYLTYGYYPTSQYPSAPIFIPSVPSDSSDYNYYWYLYLLNNGYITPDTNYYPIGSYWSYFNCGEPYANVKSGTTVEFNKAITLSSSTSGASIYYTTDGSTPDTSSALYTGSIPVNKTNLVIKAIAVKSGYKNSQVTTFTYYTSIPLSFTDLGTYSASLTPSLITLVQAKIIPDSTALNPNGSISYDELVAWLAAVGINTSKAIINDAYITDKSALSYEDFAYVCYRMMVNTSVLSSPRFSSKETLGKLKYGDEVTATPSILRAGVMSMIDAGLFYGNDFHPKAAATRAYAFYMLAQVYDTLH